MALQTAHSPSAWAMLQPRASSTQPPMRHPTMPVPEVTAANMLSAVVPGTWKVSAPALGPRNDIDDRVPAYSRILQLHIGIRVPADSWSLSACHDCGGKRGLRKLSLGFVAVHT